MNATFHASDGFAVPVSLPKVRGFHIMPALPPYVAEKRTRVELVGPSSIGGGRIVLRDLEMQARGCSYLIDTTPEAFIPDEVGI